MHDNPTLHAALAGTGEVVPLFVVDEAIAAAGFATPNRRAFLAGCLTDLDAGLRTRGGRLVVRTGDVVARTREVAAEAGADEVRTAGGVSGYAQRREERLRRALESDGRRLHVHDATLTVLPPGAVTPGGSDHFAVFTPYFRRWSRERPRDVLAAPRTVRVPAGIGSDGVPARRGPRAVETAGARTGPVRLPGPARGTGRGPRPLPAGTREELSRAGTRPARPALPPPYGVFAGSGRAAGDR